MKRILFILLVVTASTTVMAGMSTSKVRKETRFLTDKMAYELDLNNPQYNDVYEINYDFIYSLRNIMDYVVRGDEWALDDYYEALDIRNDDLRWVLSDAQYRRFLGAEYFYRPIYVTGGRWNFRIYINYPNRSLFYFGVPYHYRTYCGAHYRPHIHHVSYFRPNTSVRPHNAPTRPGTSGRPGATSRPNTSGRPGNTSRPRPETNHRPSTSGRPSTPSKDDKPNKEVTPGRDHNRGEGDRHSGSRPGTSTSTPNSNRRPETNSGSSNSSRRTTSSGTSTNRGSSSGRNSNSGSSSSRGNVSGRSTERSSSSESSRSNSNRGSSSRSSERGSSSRR